MAAAAEAEAARMAAAAAAEVEDAQMAAAAEAEVEAARVAAAAMQHAADTEDAVSLNELLRDDEMFAAEIYDNQGEPRCCAPRRNTS